jgi:hypothetical protein
MGQLDKDVVTGSEPPRVVLRTFQLPALIRALLVAMLLLIIEARRRGLSWWQWYTETPARHRR